MDTSVVDTVVEADMPAAVEDMPAAVEDMPAAVEDMPAAVEDMPAVEADMPAAVGMPAGADMPEHHQLFLLKTMLNHATHFLLLAHDL
jgi:hypothetical protein